MASTPSGLTICIQKETVQVCDDEFVDQSCCRLQLQEQQQQSHDNAKATD